MASLGDVINFAYRGTNGASNSGWVMSVDYRITSINNAGSLNTWANALKTTWVNAWVAPLLGVFTDTFEGVDVTIFNRTDPTEGLTLEATYDGTATVDGLPLRASIVVNHLTGLRGRSFRGRTSMPAPTEGQQDDGEIVEGLSTLTAAFWTANTTSGTVTDQGSMVVHSARLSTPSVVFNTIVTGHIIRGFMGSIRNRQATI